MLKMTHPEIEAVGEVLNEEQFSALYAPRGWTLMDVPTSYANDQLGRFVRDSDDLSKDEARALIAAYGGDYPDAKASEGTVKESYLQMFTDGPAQPAVSPESPTGVVVAPYDPAEYGVQEVTDYLATVDADEQSRIIDAETAGKNRVTITGWAPPSGSDTAPADTKEEE